MPERIAELSRKTKETNITVALNIDGNGTSKIRTGVGFFNHMLEGFSRHGFFNLALTCEGDLEVDCHHTIEDCGIVLGGAIKQAIGDKKGIKRFGIKNQNLMTDADIKKAYRRLMDFMNSTTSSRSGIRSTLMKMSQNFGMKFDGNYIEFSQKSKRVFDLYEDLKEMSKKGELNESDKYDLVHDLDSLYESGELENLTMDELVKRLNDLKEGRRQIEISRQSKLHFNWMV